MNGIPPLSSRDAHASPPQRVLERLHSSAAGLDADEAARRLAAHGYNRLPAPKRQGPLLRLLRQFHNVLLYMMLFASLVTALLGFWVDSAVILLAVVVNALIGFVQEGKAANALDAIRDMLSLHALVLRDGQRQALDAERLVPGDVVLLASGDRVPADLRLFETKNFHVDESALTGESVPVEKGCVAVAIDALLGDRRCMAYSGTLVTSGQARGVVVATAGDTELGRIGTLLREVRTLATPLLRQIASFSRWLALAILLLAGATFVLGTLWQGQPMVDMFMLVVALTASAIPEGLPAIMTVILALGVQRMARRNAIVSRLPAVETLGSVTVICSDKTGTLTRNEMTVQRIVTADQVIEVSGAGYAPLGGFSHNGEGLDPAGRDDLQEIGRAALLCNEARLHQEGEAWQLEGDPTEGALLSLGLKLGLDPQALAAERPRSDAIPFESEHRFMATLHHDHAGQAMVYLKGAPERILDMCEAERVGDSVRPLDPDYWRRLATDTAARGLRLLAIARRAMPAEQRTLDFADVEHGFTLLALVGIIDPPREEAVAAVAECQAAGIAVKMITGDHVDTARAIGAMLGIGIDRPALTGAEIELLDDQRLREVLPGVDVFARASPEHKLRLVQALQASGEVVAMTGDGVNDAPALKRADVGVAMGNKGTEAAKEAAEVVLADDNFATIANAVREGRAVYDNLKKFILFMLPTNGGEALIVIAAILFQLTLPMTPAQILWINMVTSSTLGLALAFDPAERGLMQRPPRPPAEPLLSLFFVWRVLLVSLLMMAGALGLLPKDSQDYENAFIVGNYPAAWREHYDRAGYARVDPTVSHCTQSVLPIFWEPSIYQTRKQHEFFEEASAAGLVYGLTMPLHGARGELGALSLSVEAENRAEANRFMESVLPTLWMLKDYALQSGAGLAFEHPVSKPVVLTSREKEVLQWCAIGKTSWEISVICNCSEANVNFHMGNIRRKFGVTSRRVAAIMAVNLGLITL